jgi:hypothetical protein
LRKKEKKNSIFAEKRKEEFNLCGKKKRKFNLCGKKEKKDEKEKEKQCRSIKCFWKKN